MKQIRKKHKFSLPITITVCIALAIVFYLSLSYFLEGYRRDIYDRIINSNISALKETTSTLISKTTEGFDHCRHEIRVLGIGMSEELKMVLTPLTASATGTAVISGILTKCLCSITAYF